MLPLLKSLPPVSFYLCCLSSFPLFSTLIYLLFPFLSLCFSFSQSYFFNVFSTFSSSIFLFLQFVLLSSLLPPSSSSSFSSNPISLVPSSSFSSVQFLNSSFAFLFSFPFPLFLKSHFLWLLLLSYLLYRPIPFP